MSLPRKSIVRSLAIESLASLLPSMHVKSKKFRDCRMRKMNVLEMTQGVAHKTTWTKDKIPLDKKSHPPNTTKTLFTLPD